MVGFAIRSENVISVHNAPRVEGFRIAEFIEESFITGRVGENMREKMESLHCAIQTGGRHSRRPLSNEQEKLVAKNRTESSIKPL